MSVSTVISSDVRLPLVSTSPLVAGTVAVATEPNNTLTLPSPAAVKLLVPDMVKSWLLPTVLWVNRRWSALNVRAPTVIADLTVISSAVRLPLVSTRPAVVVVTPFSVSDPPKTTPMVLERKLKLLAPVSVKVAGIRSYTMRRPVLLNVKPLVVILEFRVMSR